MTRRVLFTVILFLTMAFPVISQTSQVMYHMDLPQNRFMNPALKPSSSLYIGLPAISGFSVSINNNFVNFSDIFLGGRNDSVLTFLHPDFDMDDFLEGIKSSNFIVPEVSFQTFGLGFSAGKNLYLSLDAVDRVDGIVVFPGELINLFLKGNDDFIGRTLDLSGLDTEFRYFREYGLGISANITRNLRVGIRPKYLNGIAAVSLKNNALDLKVNEDLSHSLNADITARISAPVDVYSTTGTIDSIKLDKDVLKDPFFFLNSRNRGFGLDFGAEYTLGSRIRLSAAVTDLAYIKWEDRVTNLNARSSFEFSGLSIADVINGTITLEELGEELLDSLKNSFVFKNERTSFTTRMPAGLTLGGSFSLTRSFSLGVISRSIFSESKFRQAVTLSANLNAGSVFSGSLCYTAANSRYDNLGAGIALRLAVLQVYLTADRIPLEWNKMTNDGDELSISVPENWNTLTMRLGINIVIGSRKKKDFDKPMLKEQEQ